MSNENIKLTFQSNYNGWTVESSVGSELEETLVDISESWSDDDGEYEYGTELSVQHTKVITDAVRETYPNSTVSIETDNFST
jgi:hypothetical protein